MSFTLLHFTPNPNPPQVINLGAGSDFSNQRSDEIDAGVKVISHDSHERYIFWHVHNNKITLTEESLTTDLVGQSVSLLFPQPLVPRTVTFAKFSADKYVLLSASGENGFLVLFSATSADQSLLNSRPSFFSVPILRQDLSEATPICSSLGDGSKHLYFISTSSACTQLHTLVVPVTDDPLSESTIRPYFVDLALSTSYLRKISSLVGASQPRVESKSVITFALGSVDFISAFHGEQIEIWEAKSGKSKYVSNIFDLLGIPSGSSAFPCDNLLQTSQKSPDSSLEVFAQLRHDANYMIIILEISLNPKFSVTFLRQIGNSLFPCISAVSLLDHYALLLGNSEKRFIDLVSKFRDVSYSVHCPANSPHSDLVSSQTYKSPDMLGLVFASLHRSLSLLHLDVICRAVELEVQCSGLDVDTRGLRRLTFGDLCHLCSRVICAKVRAHGVEEGQEGLYMEDTDFADLRAFYSTCLLCRQQTQDFLLWLDCPEDSNRLAVVSRAGLAFLSKNWCEEDYLDLQLSPSSHEMIQVDGLTSHGLIEALRLIDLAVVNNVGARTFDHIICDVISTCFDRDYRDSINAFIQMVFKQLSPDDSAVLNVLLSNIGPSQISDAIHYLRNIWGLGVIPEESSPSPHNASSFGLQFLTNQLILYFTSHRRFLRALFTVCVYCGSLDTIEPDLKSDFYLHILNFYSVDTALSDTPQLTPRTDRVSSPCQLAQSICQHYRPTSHPPNSSPTLYYPLICSVLSDRMSFTPGEYDISTYSQSDPLRALLHHPDNSARIGLFLLEMGCMETLSHYSATLVKSPALLPPVLLFASIIADLSLGRTDNLIRRYKLLMEESARTEVLSHFPSLTDPNIMIVELAKGQDEFVIKFCEDLLQTDSLSDSLVPVLFESYVNRDDYNSAFLLLAASDHSHHERSLRLLLSRITGHSNFEVIESLPLNSLSLELFDVMVAELSRDDPSLYRLTCVTIRLGTMLYQFQRAADVAYAVAKRFEAVDCLIEACELLAEAASLLENLHSSDQFVTCETPNNAEMIMLQKQLSNCEFDHPVSISTRSIVSRDQISAELTVLKAKLEVENSPLVAELCCAGFYDEAFSIAKYYSLSANGIVVSLVSRCLQAGEVVLLPSEAYLESSNWLLSIPFFEDLETKNYVDLCWIVLDTFLQKYDDRKSLPLHAAAARSIVEGGQLPPLWLESRYLEVSPVSLLRIYLDGKIYVRAAELVVDMCRAFVGEGDHPSRFGVKNCLLFNDSEVCFPYLVVEELLSVIVDDGGLTDALMGELTDALVEYMDVVEKTSLDMQLYRKKKCQLDDS